VQVVLKETFRMFLLKSFLLFQEVNPSSFLPSNSKALTKSIKIAFVTKQYAQGHTVFTRYFALVKLYMGRVGGEKDHR